MDRVNGADWYDIGGGRRGFRGQNAALGVPGTEVTDVWLNCVQEELAAVIDAAGIVLDPADNAQLVKALRRLFLISVPVTKTVCGPGADFADLNAAHSWLAQYRIIGDGSVKLSLSAGKFASATAQYLSHVDGRRISIEGPALINGGFPAGADFAVTGSTAAARAADKAANLAMLRVRFPTELAFTGSASLSFGNVGLIKNLLVTGDGSPIDGIVIIGAQLIDLQNVVSAGFGARGVVSSL